MSASIMKKTRKSNLPEDALGPQEIAHRTISDKIRDQILNGELAPGEKLLSTLKLAKLWKTSKSTAHTALNNLVKEGLLERHHGSCTYVRESPLALSRIGIYYSTPKVWTDDERVYYRSLQGLLEEKLAKRGIEVAVFVDRRPELKQRLVHSELRKAIFNREIQGLILSLPNRINLPALLRLSLPVSVLSGEAGHSNRVGFDQEKYFRTLMSRLAEKGCKSVGIIASVKPDPDLPPSPDSEKFWGTFRREAERSGLLTRNDWIKMPAKYIINRARYGYNEFHSLWHQREHPDAVIVYPDMAVRGVITAALELDVPQSKNVTFCFHRNAHVDILCPFPALWMITDEGKVADALIDQVRQQHEGGSVRPVLLPYGCEMMQRTVEHPA